MTTTLSTTQQKLLASARAMVGLFHPSVLVSGHAYRTALSLEKRGLGSLRYQGPGARGWFSVPEV